MKNIVIITADALRHNYFKVLFSQNENIIILKTYVETGESFVLIEKTADKNAIGDAVLYTAEDLIPEGKATGDVKVEGTTYKGVKYSVLPIIMLKAIQEQQTLIELLTARVAALEE